MAIAMPKPAVLDKEEPAAQPQFHVVQPQEAVPPPEAPRTPVAPKKGLNLGGLATTKDVKAKGTVHPKATVDEETRTVITQFCADKPRFDALKGRVENLRANILAYITPQILSAPGTEYSMLAHGQLTSETAQTSDDMVMVTLQNRYTGADHEATHMALCEIIGEERTDKYFTQGVVLKVDIAKAPDELRQQILDELIPIFQKFDLMSGEEPAVVAKQVLIPKPEFHGVRRAIFTAEENKAIHAVLPCVGIVKSKNIKS